MIRRKVANGVTELWFYLRAELHKAAERVKGSAGGDGGLAPGLVDQLSTVLQDGADMQKYVCILL